MLIETSIQNFNTKNVLFYHTRSDDCNVEVHLHDSYEIFMALSSNIRYHIEGCIYDLDIGDIVITNEKEIHRPVVSDDSPYERWFVQFKPSIFSHFFDKEYNPLSIFENRPLGQNNKIPYFNATNNPIYKLFEEVELLNKDKAAKNQIIIKSLLVKILAELEERYRLHPSKEKYVSNIDDRIELVIKELDHNFSKPFNLEELSKKHFMDKYYLCHLFKDTTGFSLLEYVQSKRIQQAKMLISNGIGIMQAARQSGFDEYSNFYKTFSKLVKMPPKRYKDHISTKV